MKKIILSLAVAAMALSTTALAQDLDTLLLQSSAQVVTVDTSQKVHLSQSIQISKIQVNDSTASLVATVDYPRVQIALQDGAACVHSVTLGNATMKTNTVIVSAAFASHFTLKGYDQPSLYAKISEPDKSLVVAAIVGSRRGLCPGMV